VHGDLKAANILFDGKSVKLTDFGDSRILGPKKVFDLEDNQPEESGVSFMDIKGSILWMAPEVIMNKPVGTRSDIWSLGQTMIELTTAEMPWPGIKNIGDLINKIVQKEVPVIPEHLSAVAQDFIRQCLQYDKDKRPSAQKLLEHPFIAGEQSSSATPQM